MDQEEMARPTGLMQAIHGLHPSGPFGVQIVCPDDLSNL
jgi:hypothetical protein